MSAEETKTTAETTAENIQNTINGTTEEVSKIWEMIQGYVAEYGLKVIAAIAILVIGKWVVGIIRNIINKMMGKRNVDPTIAAFVSNMAYIALMAFVVVAAIQKLGIHTSSFVAIIGAAGLAIGFALQGSLSNFAAGFLMILFRPIKKGDYIEGAGTSGIVDEIQVFTTVLKTPDNKTVIIPNGKLMGDNIINYSTEATRRVDLVAGIGYGDDIKKAKEILHAIAEKDSRILKDPEPQIVVGELADSSVNFTVRLWVNAADYWGVYFDTTEAIKLTFDAEGISIPFPQRDVHLFQESN